MDDRDERGGRAEQNGQAQSERGDETAAQADPDADANEEPAANADVAPDRSKPGPRPKVARLIAAYEPELAGIGDELETRWTDPETDESLRTLADWFNEQLLRAALADADIETITEDVSHLYSLLAGETGSRGERTQVERRLERDGVDVEALTDEFVSYGAIRSYLTGYRNATAPPGSRSNDGASAAATARTIEGLRQRAVTVTESKLDRLQETDRLRVGPHRVFADVQVLCERCGKQYDVGDLLESGSCDCYES